MSQFERIAQKILIVDDNTVVRDVISRMLCLLGHEVSSAGSGDKGLSIFLRTYSTSSCRIMNCRGWAAAVLDRRQEGVQRAAKEWIRTAYLTLRVAQVLLRADEAAGTRS